MDKVPYAPACGSLMYAMITTRPDIAYAMRVVSRYMSNPDKKHWEAVKGIMRYLKHTKCMRICYGSQDLSVRGYTDLDYAEAQDKRRSTSSYVFTLAGGAVSWQSRLQDCITQSTIEAEYVATNEACKEAIWLGRLVADLGIKVEMPELHCDSQSAIQLAKNLVFHSKTKRIDVKYHFIREVIKDKQIQLVNIHTKDNPADLLTKGLRESFVHCHTKELSDIGIQCISHYDWHEDPLGTPIFPIPKNEIFHINGVAFEVRLSCIQGAGYGLFVHSAIESGVTILHYGGPKYSFQEWKKICKLMPRAIKYSLVEDPKVEEEEDRAYILGFVEEGNVSGYINSSHCMGFHPNVRYALDPNLPPWYKGISSHIKSEEYGHMCIETICQVEPGEELFADYEFT
ncbi:hypothetical protein L7F22_011525 [Adiantum nelumboides]|nr:hypothetical protein [Adiantum nelumboides]